ncbi:unnamed protein product [Mycena citricolor]|uniref:Uncharacterized protein n=1 Tax=Mycena citricolor TaxID=2018698 RepID=A0AAD2HNR2_9AGAR|nr:unnamed protein product [Mycena citricolor]
MNLHMSCLELWHDSRSTGSASPSASVSPVGRGTETAGRRDPVTSPATSVSLTRMGWIQRSLIAVHGSLTATSMVTGTDPTLINGAP